MNVKERRQVKILNKNNTYYVNEALSKLGTIWFNKNAQKINK